MADAWQQRTQMTATLIGWLEEVRLRVKLGHSLVAEDSPVRRCFGFRDCQDGVALEVGLTTLRNDLGSKPVSTWCEEHQVDLEVLRSAFRTVEGREELVKGQLFPEVSSADL
jgi:hypothetical protein